MLLDVVEKDATLGLLVSFEEFVFAIFVHQLIHLL
jgi:hypothetical protein